MKEGRTYWLDNLRGFITLLVVAHHATLAYTTFAHLDLHAYTASTHPIIDQVHSKGLDVFEDFNDVFFMSLMFLISGIFVLPAISRKGVGRFFSDRTKRLFIPFLITVTFIIPWGYLAAWKELHGVTDLKAFFLDFFTVEHWPPGPPWFIGILFIFNAIACWGYRRWLPTFQKWNAELGNISSKPAGLFIRWYVLTLILFVPLVLVFGGSA